MLKPVQWINQYLKDPNYENEDFKLRHYQEDIVNFPLSLEDDAVGYAKLAVAMGRGGGLTTALASRVLYNICENNNYKIIFVVPYSAHREEIMYTIKDLCKPVILQELKTSNCIIKNTKTKSEVYVFPAGISSATKGKNIRGQGMNVDEIIVDMAPMIPNMVFDQILDPIANQRTIHIIAGQRPEVYPNTYYAQAFMSKDWSKLRISATNWLTHNELCDAFSRGMNQDFFENEMLCKRVISFVEC